MHTSLATINSPEFINLQPLDINPLMSACEIKVLYVGENRNRSYITKEVATEMAKTLRGAPIVGYYREDKQDFGDHGEQVIIDGDGLKLNCLTKPYGFVAPDAKVWFQLFEEENKFGETITREYLMTTGFLWTGQFEECRSAVEGEGKPHSMELDAATLQGDWEVNSKGMDFFIINDAIFSKLCILGEDVEPCFEGSKISAPEVSASFALVDEDFKQTLFTMMQELKTALKGGQQMDTNDSTVFQEELVVDPAPAVEEPVPAEPTVPAEPAPAAEEPESVPAAASDPEGTPAPADPEPEFKKDDDEEDGDEGKKPEDEDGEGEEDEEKKKYALLETQLTELQGRYTELENTHNELKANYDNLHAQYEELVAFKTSYDDAQKDHMIESFTMLSDEDKADVLTNKSKYTVEEIEEKLSVICFRKGNFDLDTSSKNNNITGAPIVTFNYNGVGSSSEPAWISAVKKNKKSN